MKTFRFSIAELVGTNRHGVIWEDVRLLYRDYQLVSVFRIVNTLHKTSLVPIKPEDLPDGLLEDVEKLLNEFKTPNPSV